MPTENVAHRLMRQLVSWRFFKAPQCDHSPSAGFLSPSARLTVLLPHQFVGDRLIGEFSIRRICWR